MKFKIELTLMEVLILKKLLKNKLDELKKFNYTSETSRQREALLEKLNYLLYPDRKV